MDDYRIKADRELISEIMIRKSFASKIVLAFVFLLIFQLGNAQVTTNTQQNAIDQLEEKGISQKEIEERLIERGFNPNDISPETLPQYEAAIEEIIKEIESEKSDRPQQDPTNPVNAPEKPVKESVENEINTQVIEKSDDIQQRIKDGASLQEAVSEETTETIQKSSIKSDIYGHHIFQNSEISLYRAANDISTPPSYVLSTGDVLRISIFGPSQADFDYTINKDGYIYPAAMGKIYIRGLTIAKASELMRNRFSRRYTFLPEQFSLTLATARTVTINIFGEIRQPGSYTISAINTGLNALVAAGGPSLNGSVRKIRLNKGTGETKFLDVYKYLIDPKVQYDFPIDDQDIIYVPLAENIVTINGAVKRAMKYEMLEGESLEDIIGYAGGLRSDAYRDNIQVSRLGDKERVILDIRLSDYMNSGRKFLLKNGDIITVKSIPDELKSYVQASGEVLFPGDYEFKKGMSLKDLIDVAQFTDYTRSDIVYIFRNKTDGTVALEKVDLTQSSPQEIMLNVRDRVSFYSVKSFTDEMVSISIDGAVRNPNSFSFDPENNIKISDLVTLAGGLKPNANAKAILKRKTIINSGEIDYLELDIYEAISSPESKDNYVLQQGDQLIIYTNERYNNLGTVAIIGEVKSPDSIAYSPDLSFQELLTLAGGLNPNANNIAILKRYATDNSKEVEYLRLELDQLISGDQEITFQRGDQIRIYDKNMYLDAFEISILGEVNTPSTFKYDESLTLQDVIYMAGGLTFKASTNQVEVYRVDFKENSPTRILYKEINLDVKSNDDIVPEEDLQLEPFDIIIIRPIPDLDLQEVVYINGEVKYPGPYVLSRKDEKLKDIIKRSGGLSTEAFPAGATLIRSRGQKKGNILINLDDVMSLGNAHENIVMRAGDVLFIPKKENIIAIRTNATRSANEYVDSLLVDNSIQMSFQGERSAKWYINNFAGGFDKEADKKTVRVIEPNGRVRSTKKILFWYDYPTVVEGSTIALDFKPPTLPEKEKEPIDWGKLAFDTIALASSVMTVLVLATKL